MTKILDKYENQNTSNVDSQSEYSLKSHDENQQTTTILDAKKDNPVVGSRFIQSNLDVNVDQFVSSQKQNSNQAETNETINFNVQPSEYHDNHADMVSVVEHLRKPVSDIRKFGGDPLEFRTFIRQFNARIVVNAENEDEKMTYLEQYTYNEAHKVVSGYGQLNSENAYNAAMKQLHERYDDEKVIANAIIKKALGWPDIQPGNAKALD